ncbi:MAG: protein phosphatase CheZ, partial [Nitrospirae bacterium]|nr:protein phosphatase CheZ [Nitrospirota bacterium]
MINLRGKVVSVVDLGEKFGLPKRESTKDSRIMVVGLKDLGRVGLLVDSVREVLRLREDTLEPPPAMIRGISAEFIRGIGKLEDRLILLLDLSRLFEEVRLSRVPSHFPSAMETETRGALSNPAVPGHSSDPVFQEVVEAARAMAGGNFHREVHADLYGQVGELAKYINSTLKKLQNLEPNVRLTSEKIPQASLQLSEITKTTEEATHKVMSYVEQILENRDL